jgi:stage III sporulation protein AA
MDGCPKRLAVPMLLRAMTPQVIALDEVALPADVEAVRAAAGCGVTLLATVHAASLRDLEERPVGRALLACGVFRRAVLIEGRGADRRSRVERLP